ncbi:MAG: hypothetical protein R3F55_08715 [Alphaproteobacteria bacterium]
MPAVLFQILFTGVLYFMCFNLLERMSPPPLFTAFFLGIASLMMVMSVRGTTGQIVRRLQPSEPRLWIGIGTAVGVILMLPILQQLAFGDGPGR